MKTPLPQTTSSLLVTLCAVLFFGAMSFESNAQTTYTWTGAIDNTWNTAGNWSPTRTTPATSDIMIVSVGGTLTISAVPVQSVDRLSISNNTDLTLTAASAVALTVRNGAAANDLNVESGSALTMGTNLSLTIAAGANGYVASGATLTITTGRIFTLTPTATPAGTYGTTSTTIDGTMNLNGGILSLGTTLGNTLFTLNGTLNNSGSGGITSAAVTATVSATGKYNHLFNGGSFLIATWDANSEVLVNVPAGTGTIAGSGAQTYGKFKWESPSQNNTVNLGLSGTTNFITSFEVASTGTGIMSMAAGTATANINTDLVISGTSSVSMNTSASSATTINLTGHFTQGASSSFQRGTSTGTQALNFANAAINKNLSNAGTFTATGISININTNAIVTLLYDISTVGAAGSINLLTGGTLYMQDKVISGAGAFTMADAVNTTLGIGHAEGIVLTGSFGNVRTTTRTIAVAHAGNFIYNGSVAQATGTLLPPTIDGVSSFLTIDNSAGVTLTQATAITGATAPALNLTSGRLLLGNNNLSLSQQTSINGTLSSSNMIVTNGTGYLRKTFPATAFAPVVFPLGDIDGTADYSPVTLEFTSATTARTIGVRVVDAIHPNNLSTADYITRHWLFTNDAAAGTYTVNSTFSYAASGDEVGTPSNMKLGQYQPVTQVWTDIPATVSSNTLSISGANNLLNPTSPYAFEVTGRNGTGVYYRSTATGNWNDVTKWEVSGSPTGPTWTAASVIPNNANSEGIEIKTGDNITVNVATTADDIVVNGTLTIASGITLTVANGPATFDMIVNGTVINGNAATIGTITPTGAVQFAAGSTYEHAKPAGTIPTATWDPTSTCLVTGATSTIPSQLNQTFGHFTWNCASQSATLVTGAMTTTGNYNVQSTNAQILSLIASTSSATLTVGGNLNISNGNYQAKTGTTGTATINVTGDFNLTGGTFNLSASTSSGIGALSISGNYNQTSGSGTLTNTSASGISTVNLNGLATQYNQSAGTVTNTSINYTVNAATAVVTLNSPIALANGRSFVVIAGGSLYCQNNVISGGTTSVFTLNSGSTLGIGSTDGITLTGSATGNIQTVTRTFNTAANYIYNGSAAQVTGTALPATVNSLTINNSNGVTLSNSITTVTSAVNLTNGLLRLGSSNNLSIGLGSAATFNGSYSASTMIVADGTGQVTKVFPASFAGTFIYPVGDASGPSSTIEYSPVTITFAANPAISAITLGLRIVDDVAPNNGSPTDYLTRHWVFTGGTGNYNYDVVFNYPAADVVGTEGNLRISRYNSTWLSSPSSASSGTLSNLSTLTNSSTPLSTTTIYTGRESGQLYYRSVQNGDWTDVNTWESDTDPLFSAATTPVAAVPNFTNSVTTQIQAGDTVSITGTLINNYTPVLYVDGVLVNQTNAGNVIPNVLGSNFMRAGSEYRHDRDGGAVITATWDPTSYLNMTGITANTLVAALSNMGQTFGKFRYASGGQTAANVNLAVAGATFWGTFEVANTNGNAISFGAGSNTTVTLRDSLKITNGTLNMNNSGSTVTTLNLYGDYYQTGGTFQRGASTGAQIFDFEGDGVTNRYYTQSGGTMTTTGITPITVQSGGILTLNDGIVMATSTTFNLAAGGRLYMQDKVISGAGTFLMTDAAGTTVLGIGHADGIVSAPTAAGNIQTTTRTIDPAHRGNFVYNGTSAQTTGTLLPNTIDSDGSLIIDNPVSVTLSKTHSVTATTANALGVAGVHMLQGELYMSNFSLSITNSLDFVSGRIFMDNGTLTLANTNNATAILGSSFDANKMIVTSGTGQLVKNFASAAQAAFLFPIGENTSTTEYSPVSIEFTALTTGKNLGVRVLDARQPQDATTSTTDYLTRYWAFTTSNTTANTAIGNFYYTDADVNGTESNLAGNRYYATDGAWTEFASTINTTDNIITTAATATFFPTATISSPTVDYTGRRNNPVYYRSKATGNWSDVTTWEVSSDPTFTSPTPVEALVAPNNLNSDLIWIQSAHTVTMTASVTADNIVVDGVLISPGSNITLNLANGVGDDLVVNAGGQFRLQDNGTKGILTPVAGTTVQIYGTFYNAGTLNANAAFTFQSGSLYQFDQNAAALFGSSSAATWDANATCSVTGITSVTAMTGIAGVSFGHFIWNNPGQTAATVSLGITGSATRFKGNFTVENTSSTTPTNAVVMTITTGITAFIDGNLILNRGSFNLGTGSVSAGLILHLAGNYSQTGANSKIEATGTFSITPPYINFSNNGSGGGKTYTQSAGTVDNTKINYYVNATATGAVLTLNNDINLQATTRFFEVSAGGTLLMGDKLITGGTGTIFRTLTTATLGVGHAEGIAVFADGNVGNVRTATRTFSATGSYIYNGSVAQVTGTALPTSFANLTMNNTATGTNGVTMTNAVTLSNALVLNQGLLYIGNNNLTLSNTTNATALTGNTPGVGNMVVTNGTGQFIKAFTTTAVSYTPFIFPLGDTLGTKEYSPATFTFSAIGTGGNLGMRVVNSAHPSNGSATSYLNRYWPITTSTINNYTYTAEFGFNAADVVGTLGNINGALYNNSLTQWWGYTSTNGSNLLTITTSPLNTASAPLAVNNAWTGRETTPTLYYRSTAWGNWSDASTWEVSTDNLTGWTAASVAPNADNSVGILIRNNHTVTVTANTNADQLTIDNIDNSTLLINSGVTFTLKDGPPAIDMTMSANSRLLVNGTFINEGVISGSTAATTAFYSNSTYEHKQNGGTVPTAAWETTSTLLFSSLTTTSPAALGVPGGGLGIIAGFGNIIYNCPSQSADLSIGLGATTVKGNLTISSTGSTGRLALTNASIAFAILGDFNLSSGIVGITGYTNTFASALSLSGNYNQTGGDFYSILAPVPTGVQTFTFTAPSPLGNRNYTVSGGATFNTLGLMNMTVNINAELTLNAGINLGAPSATRTFTNSGTLWMGTHIIEGGTNTSFILSNATTATLGVGHVDGIVLVAGGAFGNVQTGTTRTYNASANYVFYSSAANTGTGFTAANTATFNDVDINLTVPATISGTTGALNVNSSRVSLGNNNLSLSTAGHAITGAFADSSFIVTNGTGVLSRNLIANPGTVLFPIGSYDITDGYEYSPASFEFTTAATGTMNARVIKGAHPDISNPSATAHYLERWWTFGTSALATYTIAQDGLKLYYKQGDVVGTESNLGLNRWNADWFPFLSNVDAINNILSAPSSGTFTQTTPNFILNTAQLTGRYTPIQYHYRTVANGDWDDTATWEASTDPTFTNPTPVTPVETPVADNSLSIQIRSGHQVFVTADVTVDQVAFDNTANSRLTIDSLVTFTLLNGPASYYNANDMWIQANARLDVKGTLINYGDINGATSGASGTVSFFAGSLYEHKQNGGTVPQANWNTTSTLLFSALTTTSPLGGLGAPTGGYGNITYNCPSQSADLTLALGTTTIKGNFAMQSSGTGKLVFQGSTSTIGINGNLDISGGTLGLNGFSGTSVGVVNLIGNFNQTGGSFAGVQGTATGVQTLNFAAGPNRTYTALGAINTANINFAVIIGATLTLNDSLNLDASGRSFTNNGTLWMGNKLISGGTGTTFTNASATTTTLGIGHPEGIALAADGAYGNVQTATRTYGAASNYVYNGTSAQITGSGLHSATLGANTSNILTIDNSAGVTQQRLGGTALNIGVGGSAASQLQLTSGAYQIGGTSGNLNTLALNGMAIAPLASNNLLSNKYSNLMYGAAGANTNANLYVPASVDSLNALTINITGTNSVTLDSNVVLNQATAGVLALTAGRLVLNDNNLTIASPAYAATISGGGSTSAMVVADSTGQLRKNFGTTGFAAYNFPIGDVSGISPNNTGADYSPYSLSMSANDTERIIGIRVKDAEHPQNTSNGAQSHYITRYWSFTDSQVGFGTYTYNGTLNYSTTATSDLVGTYANTQINRWSGTWTQYPGSTGTAPARTFGASQTETTAALGGSDFTLRINPQQTYEWVATSGSASWTNSASWDPARLAPQTTDILVFNRGGASTATGIPTETVAQILVMDTTNVTFVPLTTNTLSINGLGSVNNLVVDTASVLSLGNGVGTLTFTYATTTNQLGDISGTLNVNTGSSFISNAPTSTIVTVGSTGLVNNNGGSFTSSATSLVFAAGSDYSHNVTGGTIPTAGWNATSTATIASPASGTIAGTGQTFGHVVVNSSVGVVNTIGVAMSIAGNLNITSGTLSDNNLAITGNAAGTFSIGANGTYTTLRTATSWLPTNYVTANITLDPLSTINYNGATAHSIPSTQVTSYGKLALGGANVTKTLTAAISVRSLEINLGTLADGAFQITGHASGTMTMAANTGLIIGAASSTITSFPTNFVTANISLATTSTVNYNTITNAQTVSSVPSAYGNLTLTGAGTNLKSADGNILVAGNLNVATASETFDLSAYNVTVNGNISTNGTASGFNGTGKVILSGGSAAHTLTGTGFYTNIDLNDSNGATMAASSSFAINGTLGLLNGTWSIGTNTLTLNGPAINQTSGTMLGTTSSNLTFAPNTNANTGLFVPAGVTDLNNLTVNIGSGNSVTLNGALNVNAASSAITLTQGILNTTSSNLLTVVNTAVAAVSTGSTTSYINGPLRRTLPANLTTGTYRFPIGNSAYNQLELITATTNASGTVLVTASVTDGASGGSNGLAFDITPANKYWNVGLSGAGTLTSWGSVRLTESGVVSTNRIGYSTAQTGSYDNMGGTVANPLITTQYFVPVGSATNYFTIGQAGCFTAGTYTVGATGQIPRLTEVASLLNSSGLCGDVIFELQSSYAGNNETFPITFNQFTYDMSGPYDVTIRPAAGVTALTVGAPGSNVNFIAFDGTDNITLDGRQGGTGSTSSWTLRNTRNATTYAPTILLNNSAQSNTIHFLQVESQNTSTTSGTVMVGSTGTNSDNTIADNIIKNNLTGNAANGIYATGANNTSLVIDGNNFENHTNSGVLVAGAPNSLSITDNNVYQSITTTTAQSGITAGGGENLVITGNAVGGSAAGATGTWTNSGIVVVNGISFSSASSGTPAVVDNNTVKNISLTGTGAASFNGINGGTGIYVIGNTLGNEVSSIALAGTGTSAGITATSSLEGIQITKNTIDGITSSNTGAAIIRGIYTSSGAYTIEDNEVKNLTSASSAVGSGVSAALAGIVINTPAMPGQEIRDNTVHSIATSDGSAAVNTSGIVFTTPAVSTVTQTIMSDNFTTPANWTLNSGGSGTNMWEITSAYPYPGGACGAASTQNMKINCHVGFCSLFEALSGSNVFDTGVTSDRTGYTANNISTVGYTGIVLKFAWICAGSSSSYGSVRYSIDGGSSWIDLPDQYYNQYSWTCASVNLPVSAENISNLRVGFRWRNGGTGDDPPFSIANVVIEGQLAVDEDNIVENNQVHSIVTSSNNASAIVNGIHLLTGDNKVYNNMIRLGIDSAGDDMSNGADIRGIHHTNGNVDIYHNTVYVGGDDVTDSGNSYSLYSAANTTRNILNNILVNARSNDSGTGKHYGLRLADTENLNSDYNNIHVIGDGGMIGAVASTDYEFMPEWHLATLQDIHSVLGDPMFINATGDATNVDLHIDDSQETPIEATGILLTIVSDDIDSDSRSSNSPVDIGADAGDFDGVDRTPPAIVYDPIESQNLCGGGVTSTLIADITDSQSGISLSTNLPRLYFRRSVGSPTTSWTATNSVEGNNPSGDEYASSWEFEIDYSLFGITVAAGDVFEYYVVAQDQASPINIGTTQTDGITPEHSSVGTLVNAATFTFDAFGTFEFEPELGGTVYVGTGSGTPAYPSFNGAGGLFEAINGSTLISDLTVIVQSDVTEPTGAPTILNTPIDCGDDYSIRIVPDAATVRTISGNVNGPGMISLNGVSRLTIDGRFSGSGNYLTFSNTNATSAVVYYSNNSANDTITNATLRATNTSTASGIVHIGGSTDSGLGNSYLSFENNNIGGTGFSRNVIYSNGSAVAPNHDITFNANNIFNYGGGGGSYSQAVTVVGSSGDNWTFTGNSIYNTTTQNALLVGIYIPLGDGPEPIDNVVISGNYIGGTAAGATGTQTNGYNSTESYGIFLNVGTATVENNTISNMLFSNTSNSAFVCIDVYGGTKAIIDGNTLNNIQVNGNNGQQGYIFGIRSATDSTLTITDNNFGTLACLGASPVGYGSYVKVINHTGRGNVVITGNTISGPQNTAITATTTSSYAIQIANSSSTLVEGNVISDNDIFGPWILAINTANTGGLRNRGISVAGKCSGEISNNRIYDMYTESRVYGTYGIELLSNDAGTWTVSNNMIAFGSGGNARGVKYGILDQMGAGGTLNVYNNSVRIDGTEVSIYNSAPFRRLANAGASGSNLALRNNIFLNERTGGTGIHNAIASEGTNFASNWDSDYNFLAARDTSFTGNWGGTSSGFTTWQTSSSGDTTSTTAQVITSGNSGVATVRPTELFINPSNNLHILATPPNAPSPYWFIESQGTPVAEVTDDIDGDIRNLSNPDIGADEVELCDTLEITIQPIDIASCDGDSVFFNTSAFGIDIGYSWQYSDDNGVTWFDIPDTSLYAGADSDTLFVNGISFDTDDYLYRAIVLSPCGNDTTDVAILNVLEEPEITAYNPPTLAAYVCSPSITGFSIEADGEDLTFEWQVSEDSGATWDILTDDVTYSGTDSDALMITNTPDTLHGNLYRVIVTNGCALSDTSSVMTLNVGFLSIETEPASNTNICEGDNAIIGAEIIGNSLEFQWQVSTDNGSSWNDVVNGGVYSGATTDSLDITAPGLSMSGYQYRLVIETIACLPDTTSVSILNIDELPSATISGATTICSGSSTNITFSGTVGADVTYTVNGGSPQVITLDGGGSYILNTGALLVETTYLLVSVENGVCSVPLEDSAVVSIASSIDMTITANETSLCEGESTTVTIDDGPAFGELIYTINGGSDQYIMLNASGSATINTGALYADRTYELISVADEFCEVPLNDEVEIVVSPAPEAAAGSDINVACDATSITLSAASADNGTSIFWETSGDGTFNFDDIENPIYTFGASDDETVTLTLTVAGAGGCEDAIDVVVVNIAQAIWYIDADGDGFGEQGSTPNCNGGVGYANNDDDFCDEDSQLHPNTAWFVDFDGDGYGSYIHVMGDVGADCDTVYTMAGVGNLVIHGSDCNDGNINVHPGAVEICFNGIDDDCDGIQNEGCPLIAPPSNDNPATNNPNLSSATYVYPNCTNIQGTTLGATINPATGTRDVWYQFTAISNGVSIKVNSSAFDAKVYLFSGLPNSLTLLNDENLTSAGTEILNFGGLTAGQTYRIAVSSTTLADGAFTLCLQQLRKATCGTAGPYSLCTIFKSTPTGATTTTFEFTDNLDVSTMVTSGIHQVTLSNTTLQLSYGSSYDVTLIANYELTDGNNQPELISVSNEACSVAIGSHPALEVKSSQRCVNSATLSRNSYLLATTTGGTICGVTGYRVEFTPVSNCNGDNPQVGQMFSKTITSPTASISLSYAFNALTPLVNYPGVGYWKVRWKPRFGINEGDYGNPHVIAVYNTSTGAGMVIQPDEEMNGLMNSSTIEANLYPNPNVGDMVNLNLTGITSPDVYVRIMDGMGRVVYNNRYSVEGMLNTIVTFSKPLAGGVYMVEFTTGNEVITQRMIITR